MLRTFACLRLSLAVLIGALTAGTCTAAAQQAATEGTAKQSAKPQRLAWASNCSSVERQARPECAISQRVITTNGQLVGSITLRVPADSKDPVAMVQMPLGLFLPAGVTLDVDGTQPLAFPLQTCNATGCYTGFVLPAGMLERMFKGEKLNVTFQYLDRKSVVLPMSLAGFTEAFGRIR